MSVLSALGKDAKSVWAWIISTKGQAVIAAGEAGVETLCPLATGAINLANAWMAEIIKTETLAAAADQQTGTGTVKSAAVIATITPEVLAFATANKLPTPSADNIQKASDALVTFLNVLGESSAKVTS